MTITVANVRVSNYARSQIVEDAYRAYFSFAGVHDFRFRSLYDGSYTYNTSGSGWHTHAFSTVLPREYTVSCDISSNNVGIAVGVPVDTGPNHYIAGIDGSNYPYIAVANLLNSTVVTRLSIPKAISPSGRLKVAFREISFDSSFSQWWVAITMWLNDKLLATYIEDISGQPNTDYTFGVCGNGTGSYVFNNIHVPQLTNFIEWNSLDPGEHPIGGLQRALEGRYTKMFIRWNGALYAWRPVTRTADMTLIDNAEITGRQSQIDNREVYSHVRMVGAWIEAEYARNDMGIVRFTELKNPMLMTANECYREAISSIRRMEENQIQSQLELGCYLPLLEQEDRVDSPVGSCIVTSSDYNLAGEIAEQRINARQYVEGV